MSHQRPAIRVTCPNRPAKGIKRFPKAHIAQMRDIQNNPQPTHLREQFSASCSEAPRSIGALGVRTRAVMRRADGAQTLCISGFEVMKSDQGIGSLQTENISNRQLSLTLPHCLPRQIVK